MYSLHNKFFYLKQEPLINDILNNISLFKNLSSEEISKIKENLIELKLIDDLNEAENFLEKNIVQRNKNFWRTKTEAFNSKSNVL